VSTGATEFIDATTAAAFFEEVWSKKAIIAREQGLLMPTQVNRVFEKELIYGNKVHVPSIGNLSVQSKNLSSNAATVYETITETNTDITVNTWEYSAIAVETATRKQSNRDLLATYAPKQGYALALSIDDALNTLFAGGGITQNVGTLTLGLTYDDLLRADQYLNDGNVPQDNRFLNISPAEKANFGKMDQMVHGDYSKLNADINAAMKGARLGTWMGTYPVAVSTNVDGSNAAGHSCVLMHMEAIALVVQMSPTTHTMFDLDYFANKVGIEQLRGQAIMRADHAVVLKGK
jgi:hypothetical protein